MNEIYIFLTGIVVGFVWGGAFFGWVFLTDKTLNNKSSPF